MATFWQGNWARSPQQQSGLQQISQPVPPPEKPSPHTARKKIKTQKLKKKLKKETEKTHQTKSKKEETTPRRTRKKKHRRTRKKKTKTEDQKRRRSRKKNKKEETTPRRTRKKKKTEEQERRNKPSQHKIETKILNGERNKNRSSLSFLYPLIIPAAVFQTKNIFSGKENAHLYTSSTARKVQYTRSFSNFLSRY